MKRIQRRRSPERAPLPADRHASRGGRGVAKKAQSAGLDRRAKRALIAPSADRPSLRRPYPLIGRNRSSGDAPDRPATERAENRALRPRRAERYPATPFSGSRKPTAVGRRADQAVNRKRVPRLMRLRGGQPIAPTPNPRRAPPAPQVDPDRLRAGAIRWPNPVWATESPTSRVERGVAYRVAVLDGYRRPVRAWRLSRPDGGAQTHWAPGAVQPGSGQPVNAPGVHRGAPGARHPPHQGG